MPGTVIAALLAAVLAGCAGEVPAEPTGARARAEGRAADASPLADRPSRPEKAQPAAAGRRGAPPRAARTRSPDRPGVAAVVSQVVDGDTVEVLLRGRQQDVRLIGVDTPETVHPSVGVECYGPAASRFTKARLEGRRVRLSFDEERRDHYGRLLAYVWVGERLFNRLLVARGFAAVTIYEPNDHYAGRLYAAQRSARRREAGLWGACGGPDEPLSGGGAAGGGGGRTGGAAGGGGAHSGGGCTPGYDPCLPPASDYDCAGGGGDGPRYVQGPVRVSGSDPYALDADGDGVACES